MKKANNLSRVLSTDTAAWPDISFDSRGCDVWLQGISYDKTSQHKNIQPHHRSS